MTNHQIKVGVSVCTPMPFVMKSSGHLGMRPVSVEWHRHRMSMQMGTNIQFYEIPCDGMEVGDARNVAAERARGELQSEFLFFIDSDVILPFDALKKLMKRAREFSDFDIFTGVYSTKDINPEPLLYMQDGTGPWWDWAIGDLIFDIASCGMGCALIRTSLFDKIEHTDENPWFLSTNTVEEGDGGLLKNIGTEDIWFCRRAREEAGARIMADTSILCGHQDVDSGVIYGMPQDSDPYKRGRWLRDHADEKLETKAIDLGWGGEDMSSLYPDYRWYTLDIRPDLKPDYVQDIRGLNLPDNHFDLVFSSHTLEHIGRWDQEKVWGEIARICKPGGKVEIWVPNILWAAHHMVDGVVNLDVMNVLYGAQESHGYKREYNTHFFGYTPEIGKTLAELVGLKDVVCRTWKEDDQLGYNLKINGVKMTVEEANAKSTKEPVIEEKPKRKRKRKATKATNGKAGTNGKAKKAKGSIKRRPRPLKKAKRRTSKV